MTHQWVPKEPTEAMLIAGDDALLAAYDAEDGMRDAYVAMLAAAPDDPGYPSPQTELRDEFIVSRGLWMEFVEQLPKHTAAPPSPAPMGVEEMVERVARAMCAASYVDPDAPEGTYATLARAAIAALPIAALPIPAVPPADIEEAARSVLLDLCHDELCKSFGPGKGCSCYDAIATALRAERAMLRYFGDLHEQEQKRNLARADAAEAQVKRLREALKPFADLLTELEDDGDYPPLPRSKDAEIEVNISVKALRGARAALATKEPPDGRVR